MVGKLTLLGVDAGSSAIKAVLFDDSGTVLSSDVAPCPPVHPHPGWSERDMENVWSSFTVAVRGCLSSAPSGTPPPSAVGIVGANDGVYPVDQNGRSTRAAITSTDTRAAEVLEEWDPIRVRLLQMSGQFPFLGSPATLLSWLDRHEPEVIRESRWYLFCKDWLRLRLTGHIGTDPSEASASFLGVESQSYDPAIAEAFGLDHLMECLPPIYPSAEGTGTVTDGASQETDIPTGTPVVTGAHDVDGAAIGLGAAKPGDLSVVAGTFSINQIVSRETHLDERWQARAFVVDGLRLNMATSATSAANVSWAVNALGYPDAETLDREVISDLDEDSEIVFLPFVHGGMRDANASAGFSGIRARHGRTHLARAVYEGVAFSHRTHLDDLSDAFDLPDSIGLTGGLSASAVWPQILADTTDRAVKVTACREAGALGAAVLAGLGVDVWPNLDAAISAVVRVETSHQPNPDRVTDMEERYRRYVETVRNAAL